LLLLICQSFQYLIEFLCFTKEPCLPIGTKDYNFKMVCVAKQACLNAENAIQQTGKEDNLSKGWLSMV